MKNLLVRFHWDCRRMGEVEGLFVCTEEEYNDLIGEDVYFGEILGKHSEVYGTVTEEDLTIISDDQEKINWLVEVIGDIDISGYNPLNYVREDEDEEGEDEVSDS